MMNMYAFNFNCGGFKIAINVVSENICEASKKAYERCADNVGRNFKTKALDGGYLVSVDVIHGVERCK